VMPPAHIACLEMLGPVMTLREGARIYAPGGNLLRTGDLLEQPGLVRALESISANGVVSVYTGAIATSLLELSDERGGLLTADDLHGYQPAWAQPVQTAWLGMRFLSRAGLSGVPHALARLPRLRGLSPADRVVALVGGLDGRAGPETHTTNLVTVDADGNACVLTTSLGLGSGDWLPGFDLHLNSMLGEADLLEGPLDPGARMASMMAPSVVLDDAGLVLAIGAAGGTRLRSALVAVAAGILDEGLEPQDAVDRGRVHPAGDFVHAEPGVDDDGLEALAAAGRVLRRWPERHHFFGGVSALGRTGAAADPRRSGATRAPAAA
jgi:gamma-glutamyltranspeptidase/glutathione hydrolase